MYKLVNVPTARSEDAGHATINGQVDREQVKVVCEDRHGSYVMMDTYVGDHMFERPDDLRQMYANDLANTIRLARDAGYRQAFAELRELIKSPR